MKVTYKGVPYQVGYTRAAARDAERAGFDINECSNKPNLMVPILVFYAFRAYNRKISQTLVEEIYEQLPRKDDFVAALIEQYGDTVNTLMDNSDQGNAEWTMD